MFLLASGTRERRRWFKEEQGQTGGTWHLCLMKGSLGHRKIQQSEMGWGIRETPSLHSRTEGNGQRGSRRVFGQFCSVMSDVTPSLHISTKSSGKSMPLGLRLKLALLLSFPSSLPPFFLIDILSPVPKLARGRAKPAKVAQAHIISIFIKRGHEFPTLRDHNPAQLSPFMRTLNLVLVS